MNRSVIIPAIFAIVLMSLVLVLAGCTDLTYQCEASCSDCVDVALKCKAHRAEVEAP
jgi:hypothetical protein